MKPQKRSVQPKTKYASGDSVWVPSSRLSGSHDFALVQRKVLGQKENGRSVVVDDAQSPEGTTEVASRLVHDSTLGILVLRVGDLTTEETLLNPLAKSVLQYLRLLLQDDAVQRLDIRTEEELRLFMAASGSRYSHLVLVGHGSPTGLILPGRATYLPPERFAQILSLGGSIHSVVSLACKTGLTRFGRSLTTGGVRELAAPTSPVHGASASLFAQQFLAEHLLEGRDFATSVRRANSAVGPNFVHWRGGKKNALKKPGRPKGAGPGRP